MKKILVSALAAIPFGFMASAQSAMDAFQLSTTDLNGTARFVSMGGAFTALGGDISTIGQNPGGLGVYRKSEIALTVSLDFQNNKMETGVGNFKDSKTNFICNNFGYVGTVNTGSDVVPTFSWGVSYERVASFKRTYHIGSMSADGNYTGPSLNTSLSNYIASYSNGYSPADLLDDTSSSYNPYLQSDCDWLSILAYNSYMINPSNNGNPPYQGLWKNGISNGDMGMDVRERGSIDEYNLSFGGNVSDILYWGVGFGITDLYFTQETNYNEQINNARIPNPDASGVQNGDAYFNLNNWRNVNGTGLNFKLGVIVKPINELRVGVAIHTPTYYNLSQSADAGTNFSYSSGYDNMQNGSEYSYFDWKLRTPWRLMFGVAGVIDARYILSAGYEYAAYDDMKIKSRGSYYDYTPENNDIKSMYTPQSTIRLGGEVRITPQFSARVGYVYSTSGVKSSAKEALDVVTSGLNPAYSIDDNTQYITLGLGYRWSNFYIDAAFVNRKNESTWHAFTDYNTSEGIVKAPKFNLSKVNNQVVLTLGYRF